MNEMIHREKRTGGDDETPMMQQYQRIKAHHPDSILFFRMGDFYEMFNEDAQIASRILQIALTSRNKNKSNPIPMCGIPHHSANGYIGKLVQAGKNVAICEQMEDPRQVKGIVKREVVRVITPGTVLDDNLLDPKSHHFLVALSVKNRCWGLAALDLTTGLFKATEITGEAARIRDEIAKMDAREILVPASLLEHPDRPFSWLDEINVCVHSMEDWNFSKGEAYRALTTQFKTASLEGFGIEHWPQAIASAGALIQYLQETNKTSLEHLNALSPFNIENFMLLDGATIRNLELVQSSDGDRKGSLLALLDESLTPMGARRIKEWILKPLLQEEAIRSRCDLVQEMVSQPLLRDDIRGLLKSMFDMERLLGRISLGACHPRDLIALKSSLEVLPGIRTLLTQSATALGKEFLDAWDDLDDTYSLIDRMIVDDPPLSLKDGKLIKSGCDEELDRLKEIAHNGKAWIAQLETRERERTGIAQLKVGYNKIYGYYLEATKKNLDRIPDDYIRKQSLVNSERFISPELKEYETEISGAEEKIIQREQELFQAFRESIAKESARIQHMADIISRLDALLAFALVAHRNNYCRPAIHGGPELSISNGRHPLIEYLHPEQPFVPNDTELDCDGNQVMIITGPNMAGKSTYIRQVAMITLMAQIGGFIPADQARIGLVDRIFSRVGAQDHLLKGQSTFMVEMNETANILNSATRNSLIILDEIGRGTSTFDGISIAWSIVEYLHGPKNIGAKTIFATHYHELTELALIFPGVNNFNVTVKEWNDEIIFLRKIIKGGADKSYGIQVARLAGIPEQVLARAREVLSNLEESELDEGGTPKIAHSQEHPAGQPQQQMRLFEDPLQPLIQKIKTIDPDGLTPRQALDKLYELLKMVEDKTS